MMEHNQETLQGLLQELIRLPSETEWVEFKHNNADPEIIGQNISALANSAALYGKKSAYVLWGIEDNTHQILGTTFNPGAARHKQQALENWLLQKLKPKINFCFHVFLSSNEKQIVILEIQPASHTPVRFDGTEFIRVQSSTKKLREFTEKERELWRVFDRQPFEQTVAKSENSVETVFQLINVNGYFELLSQPMPSTREEQLKALEQDGVICQSESKHWDITHLGAVLFAKKLSDFPSLARKTVRLIQYKGSNKLETFREVEFNQGYAVDYENIIRTLTLILPSNEEIGSVFRREVPMYPELALRELIANAIIHQDFTLSGTSPMIEVFEHRIEITNPGVPLVAVDRFVDNPPRSRNEGIAALLRRMNICEERGSGIDKVVMQTEIYQLPAPLFEVFTEHTRSVLFAYRDFKNTDRNERIRACYLHSVLKYLSREPMSNASLRERFGIDVDNSAMVSRVIKQTIEAKMIKPYDETAGTKSRRYIPFWA
ncbi:ATP-binding protein [Testudinibacter sp. TR-2022]|uniref:ATP-binding protein n=1 Tax=Testudinibacter sp. TR-2022 TaxID=2585029 RepID=UPI00111AEDE6|nr:RNA-binding domain-containing protein [Testudinibacter sp. TR-2022]TNH06996.1 transcriptional regulator [Pasteurellaceae bacterium Phil11]TNH22865.1 transcriptional regulator [Testudinibacter sp. TR-2022]TNH25285.1 transcriptional regulator [Testudinibacter sp. TR-2022]